MASAAAGTAAASKTDSKTAPVAAAASVTVSDSLHARRVAALERVLQRTAKRLDAESGKSPADDKKAADADSTDPSQSLPTALPAESIPAPIPYKPAAAASSTHPLSGAVVIVQNLYLPTPFGATGEFDHVILQLSATSESALTGGAGAAAPKPAAAAAATVATASVTAAPTAADKDAGDSDGEDATAAAASTQTSAKKISKKAAQER